mgnify:CR=1 FL=1
MSTENLYNEEAKAKIKEMVEDIDFAMMATHLSKHPIHTIPMSTKKVDDEGAIWFLSGKDSTHNSNIETDSRVQLLYSKPGSMQFLTLYGRAYITTEHSILKELYSQSDDMWFDGLEDPNLTAICVNPAEANYWDSKHNRLATIFKMGIATVTGENPEIGQSGKIVL